MSITRGQPLPAVILNAPSLMDGLSFFYRAFLDLSTERPLGFGEGPIPWSAIEAYADRWELEDEERDDLSVHMRAMDKAYLGFRAKKTAQVESPPPPTKRTRRG